MTHGYHYYFCSILCLLTSMLRTTSVARSMPKPSIFARLQDGATGLLFGKDGGTCECKFLQCLQRQGGRENLSLLVESLVLCRLCGSRDSFHFNSIGAGFSNFETNHLWWTSQLFWILTWSHATFSSNRVDSVHDLLSLLPQPKAPSMT